MASLLPIDSEVTDLLRENGGMTISALARKLGITGTAIRQRLNRLMDSNLVRRDAESKGRGRPSHRYSLTELGQRHVGGNFADLAFALWEEIRSIPDADVRSGLLKRIADRMANSYQVAGKTTKQKMQAVADLFRERDVPITMGQKGELPVLTARCCPYPDLAEQDRGICAMEKMMLSEMVGEHLRLSECRLDGGGCCTFELTR